MSMTSSRRGISGVDLFLHRALNQTSKSLLSFLSQLFHTPALAILMQVFVAQASHKCLEASIIHSLTHSHTFIERGGRNNKVTGRSGASCSSVHAVSIFIGPCASVENSSNIYCFYNASKFFALIDDAFTGSKSLSQSQTPLREVWRTRGRKK